MSRHKEHRFQTDTWERLAASALLYAEGDAASYRRAGALFPADMLAWVNKAHPQPWEMREKDPSFEEVRAFYAKLWPLLWGGGGRSEASSAWDAWTPMPRRCQRPISTSSAPE